jgi:predicted metalloprotease with PDZ domain
MSRSARPVLLAIVLLTAAAHAFAQAPVRYRLAFPEREHRLMEVEATFADVPDGPLQLRMSRSSPGRYAVHEFAKNIVDVRITNEQGGTLTVSRPNPHQWNVTGHSGVVRVRYRIFGDRVDGTYLAVDSTHAHINMPAALMWARGFEMRPVTLRFEPPAGSDWRVATQLMPGDDPFTFTAPNLQYLMDSPSEFSAFALRTFTVADGPRSPTFRLAVHHDGSGADVDALARDVQTMVREARAVYGEYPAFENNAYTFIADYLPYANGDAMEHRNSTILSSPSSIRSARQDLLDTITHEFFHAWNVERIRPRSLEPFNFEDANLSGELWLAEGFTSYYAPLITARAGLTTPRDFVRDLGSAINTVLTAPGRQVRSAVEMSQFAPFVDAATAIDRTPFENTFISYYTWGSAIGLGLDLTLRDRSDGRVTLDHYMRALWERFGRPGGQRPGYVDQPYTLADLQETLAAVSGDAAFAAEFFGKYIAGREVVDYARLLARAGFVLRPTAGGRGFAGDLRLQDGPGGARVTGQVPFGSPAYAAGLHRDDVIVSIAGRAGPRGEEVIRAIEERKPGETVPITFERRGSRVSATLTLATNPSHELVMAEAAGQTPSDAQRRFREAWLGSAQSVKK